MPLLPLHCCCQTAGGSMLRAPETQLWKLCSSCLTPLVWPSCWSCNRVCLLMRGNSGGNSGGEGGLMWGGGGVIRAQMSRVHACSPCCVHQTLASAVQPSPSPGAPQLWPAAGHPGAWPSAEPPSAEQPWASLLLWPSWTVLTAALHSPRAVYALRHSADSEAGFGHCTHPPAKAQGNECIYWIYVYIHIDIKYIGYAGHVD